MKGLKIVGISSSPRHANTEILVKEALWVCKEELGLDGARNLARKICKLALLVNGVS